MEKNEFDKKTRRVTVLFSPRQFVEIKHHREVSGNERSSISAHMRELVLNAVRTVTGKKNYEKYIHHGNEVWVRSDLKGSHRDHCLCHSCSKLNIDDRAKNCPIAKALYDNCVNFKVVTPVFECPEFVSKT